MRREIIIGLIVLALAGGAMALTLRITGEGLEQAHSDARFWNELGYKLAQEGDSAGAQGAFLQAVALDPNYENARKNLYVAAFGNEDYETALEHVRILHDANDQYTFDLAQALVMHARFVEDDAGEAIAQLEEAASLLESLGDYPNAAQNARIVRNVLAEALNE